MNLFVYGHYDSRGGTSGVFAPDRPTADAHYNQELFSVDWADLPSRRGFFGLAEDGSEDSHPCMSYASPADQDFLYEAELENPFDVVLDGELEGDGEEFGSTPCAEVWAEAHSGTEAEPEDADSPYREPNDGLLVRLRVVPGVPFEDAPSWQRCGWHNPDFPHHTPLDPESERMDPDGTMWRLLPTQMVRLPDGSVFHQDADERAPGWEHPSWGDDAYNFIVMTAPLA